MHWELTVYKKTCILDKNIKITYRWCKYKKYKFKTKSETMKFLNFNLKLDRIYHTSQILKYTLRGGVKRG